MKKGFFAVVVLSLSFLSIIGTGCQDTGTMAVTGKVGTTGYGGDLTVGFLDDIDARVGINTLDFDFDADFGDVEYNVGVDFDSMSGLIDWHIFDDSFHLTGGFHDRGMPL